MTADKLKVLIFYQRNWGMRFGQFLCERLERTYPGTEFSALIFKRTARESLEQQKTIHSSRSWFWEDHLDDPARYVGDDPTTLDEIAAALGVDSIWPFVQSLRIHVKDYARKYYYAFTQSTPDAEIRRIVVMTYKLIVEMLDTVRPNLIIMPNAVALPHLFMLTLARKRGIFVRNVTDTKISGYYMWVRDHNDAEGIVFDRFVQHAHTPVESLPCFPEARNYLETFREKFIKPDYAAYVNNPDEALKKIINPLFYLKMLELAFRRKFSRKHRMPNTKAMHIDRLPPRLIIRDHVCEYRYLKAANGFAYDPIPDDFIYFPLQFQPEQTIDVIAPHFNNQLECARLTAMSMPGSLALVVKDHPAMAGKRSPEYLFKLKHQVNICLVDYRTPSKTLLARARGVIAPSGTTLVEAAFLNKPVIQFGNLGVSLLLPQVKQCTDFTRLSALIKSHMLGFDPTRPENDQALLRYIALAMEYGFKMNYGGIWEGGSQDDKEPMWHHLHGEIAAWLAEGKGTMRTQ
ncbi:MAG: hypothetical protein HQM02_07380 [Magnetococcales bacterium]|nr:hypothetical protein [Magnetococcales bacterium]